MALGDSGFGIEPFLLTVYRNPTPKSPELRFNQQHAKACNIIRYRCLKSTLLYTPLKVTKIINVCWALYSICRTYQIDDIEPETGLETDKIDEEIAENEESKSLNNLGKK